MHIHEMQLCTHLCIYFFYLFNNFVENWYLKKLDSSTIQML